VSGTLRSKRDGSVTQPLPSGIGKSLPGKGVTQMTHVTQMLELAMVGR
jgi:hypothetical protein